MRTPAATCNKTVTLTIALHEAGILIMALHALRQQDDTARRMRRLDRGPVETWAIRNLIEAEIHKNHPDDYEGIFYRKPEEYKVPTIDAPEE